MPSESGTKVWTGKKRSRSKDGISSGEESTTSGHPPQKHPNQSRPSLEKSSKGGKSVAIPVHFLDNSVTTFRVQWKSLGKQVFDQVCEMLNIIEIDYFGLEYFDESNTRYWLDLEKPIGRQLSFNFSNPRLHFAVKFYTPDPSKLEDELTRYLYSLQIKKDLSEGLLQCNENTAALMASYIIQAEIGDFNSAEYQDQNYVARFKLIPDQDASFEWKVMENHKKHIGQSPTEADLNLLETARRCELYGVKMTAVTDHEGVPLNLAVTYAGVLVFQNCTKINTLSWTKIRKLSFKRKRFLLKLHQEECFGDVIEFLFETRNQCKNFWKKCIEQHTFFRCSVVKKARRTKAKIFSRGSSFRYSGRTQQQIVEYFQQNSVKRSPFQRSSSLRTFGKRGLDAHDSSAPLQPLLPIGSPNLDQISPIATDHAQQRSKSAMEYRPELHEQYFSSTVAKITDESVQRTAEGTKTCHRNSESVDSGKRTSNGEGKNESFNIWQEFLFTVKTFTKDFELLEIWFNNKMASTDLQNSLVLLTNPLFMTHSLFHEKFETHLKLQKPVGSYDSQDSFKFNVPSWLLDVLTKYENLYERLPSIVDRLNCRIKHDDQFESICKEFEACKGCYLPYSFLILKPVFHVFTYCSLLEKLQIFLRVSVPRNCLAAYSDALQRLNNFVTRNDVVVTQMLNSVVQMELQRDIIGFHKLISTGRKFVRLGSLLKLSQRGYQQRMFFLFTDILIYCSRSSQSHQFKIHGVLPLDNVTVEKTPARMGINHCFTIYGGDRAVMVAAYSEKEMELWIKDVQSSTCRTLGQNSPLYEESLSEEIFEELNNILQTSQEQILADHPTDCRANTLIHVCWHRSCTISLKDYQIAFSNCLSGYLLRKFKNTNGWQKLWVTFADFCLFFYKANQDHFPLASLPILGYSLSTPTEEITEHQFVFKLQFKSHVYFFRTENQYWFQRWLEIIGSVTSCTTYS